MRYKLQKEPEYEDWFADESPKSQAQIEKRLLAIIKDGHFGHTNFFDGILELKFTVVEEFIQSSFTVKKLV